MNNATRKTIATLGTIFGISGISHGLFEVLQGYAPTGGFIIAAIGETHRMWPHGNEYAFTLMGNFLATGIAAMMIGLCLVVWSLYFVHGKHGPSVFLLLFILLFLFGGGIAQIIFFPFYWIVATRINKPLVWWRTIMPFRLRKVLGKLWPWSLVLSATLMLFALAVAVTGFIPGVNDPDTVLSIMLTSLVVAMASIALSIVAGFARDIAMKSDPEHAAIYPRNERP